MSRSLLFLLLVLCPLQASCDSPKGVVPLSGKASKASGWKKEVVVRGLNHPWSMAWLPDRTMLITERAGKLRRVKNGNLESGEIEGVPPVLARGQGGLLDISVHPRFSENQLLYFTFAAGTAEENRTSLARARYAGNRLESLKVLWQNPDAKPGAQHFGSRIAWRPDGTLLMSVGDGGNRPTSLNGGLIRRYAQDRTRYFGKVLRFNDDGSAPTDNPYSSRPEFRPEIFTFGHRNIQGLTVDAASNRIWANEHGSQGGDELNLLEAGGNYGWPEVSYSNEYGDGPVAEVTSRDDCKDPKVVWTPSPAPSGLLFYTGDRFPKWKGDLLSGNLAEHTIRRIDLDGERIVGQETLEIGNRVRDIRLGPDGEIYVLTDEEDGELLRIVPE